MKLQELAVTRPTKQIAKVFESHFDQRVSFDTMNRGQLRGMLNRVRGLVQEHRASPAFHHSEKNPAYLKLMMMEQALTQQLQEYGAATPEATAPGANPAATAALATAQQQQKKRQMQDQIKQKQKEITNLQKAMANPAMMMAAENNTGNFLRESEIQQAQVVLAAQDMVDRVQKMLEDTTEMQFKELPALVDSIKNEVGMDQAAQFNADAAAALSGLVQNLQASKGQLEAALGVVTGQGGAPVVPGAEAGADLGAEMGADLGADLGAEAGLDAAAADAGAELEPEPEAATPAASLGRGRR
jgi:primosomal protein N'